jgi:hypothetical protein
VSNIALGKQLSSAHNLTLCEAASAEYLFSEWATPIVFRPSPSALALIAFRLYRSGWLLFLPTNPSDNMSHTQCNSMQQSNSLGLPAALLAVLCGACTSLEPYVISLSSRSNTLLVIQCLGCQLPIAMHLKYILDSQR